MESVAETRRELTVTTGRTALVLAACLVAACSSPDPAERSSSARRSSAGPAADAVYVNGQIYTVDDTNLWAEAVAIADGRFVAVGSDAEIDAFIGPATAVTDLRRAFVMPGLVDVHTHPSLLMEERVFCVLPGTLHDTSEAQILARLAGCVERHPDEEEWFIAQGFTPSVLSPAVLHRDTLDRLLPERPAFIVDESGGSAWVNGAALARAGLDADVRDTATRQYGRDPRTGELTGRLFGKAVDDLRALLPPRDTAFRKRAIGALLKRGLARGITTQGDAYVLEEYLEAWQELAREDAISAHVVLFLAGNVGAELTPVSELVRWRREYQLPGPQAVKITAGGAIELGTAPLVDGYLDPAIDPQPNFEPEQLAAHVRELDRAGFQVKAHAVGDGTVRATLDAYEATIRDRGDNGLRHHIDHCSLIHPDDLERLADLDVGCTIWPVLSAPVEVNLGLSKLMLKPSTWARLHANRDRWRAGVHLASHSDAPSAVLWPWWGLEAVVTRGLPGRPEVEPMAPKQALTLAQAIRAHTLNGAWTLRLDDLTGSIEVGKSADLIVLSHNLFEVEPTRIHRTQVRRTVVGGEVVHAAD